MITNNFHVTYYNKIELIAGYIQWIILFNRLFDYYKLDIRYKLWFYYLNKYIQIKKIIIFDDDNIESLYIYW